MKFLFTGLAALMLTYSSTAANDWETGELPVYFYDIPFGAVGSDGLLYEMKSNPNGYVLTSLIEKFRFEPTGQFTGNVLTAQAVIYLGASCDAEGDGLTGKWTKDGTGLNFAIEGANGVLRSFRLLSDGLEPSHTC